ncbi:hypothetical protein HDU76_010282, partial [Blyttiomyces sp. JEL0837]
MDICRLNFSIFCIHVGYGVLVSKLVKLEFLGTASTSSKFDNFVAIKTRLDYVVAGVEMSVANKDKSLLEAWKELEQCRQHLNYFAAQANVGEVPDFRGDVEGLMASSYAAACNNPPTEVIEARENGAPINDLWMKEPGAVNESLAGIGQRLTKGRKEKMDKAKYQSAAVAAWMTKSPDNHVSPKWEDGASVTMWSNKICGFFMAPRLTSWSSTSPSSSIIGIPTPPQNSAAPMSTLSLTLPSSMLGPASRPTSTERVTLVFWVPAAVVSQLEALPEKDRRLFLRLSSYGIGLDVSSSDGNSKEPLMVGEGRLRKPFVISEIDMLRQVEGGAELHRFWRSWMNSMDPSFPIDHSYLPT